LNLIITNQSMRCPQFLHCDCHFCVRISYFVSLIQYHIMPIYIQNLLIFQHISGIWCY